MTIIVRYEGEIAATVGRSRIYLAPQIEALPDGDERLGIVLLMCDYALQSGGRVYSDEGALAHAQSVLARTET